MLELLLIVISLAFGSMPDQPHATDLGAGGGEYATASAACLDCGYGIGGKKCGCHLDWEVFVECYEACANVSTCYGGRCMEQTFMREIDNAVQDGDSRRLAQALREQPEHVALAEDGKTLQLFNCSGGLVAEMALQQQLAYRLRVRTE